MPIDVLQDKLMPLQDLRERFPMPSGKPRTLRSILQWVTQGLRCSHRGDFVKLEAKRVGSTWMTTEDAVHKFTEETTRRSLAAAGGDKRPVRRETAANKRARARLRARGLCR
jgi:hypothetical protein